ncbi:hypothetical protein QBC38DRAFT_462032 [Podospora fimiseda]|uniref:Uncharacterized protein n=1 Tax=Podospora fimiseda TaxID=252190 RepID=A0AAN6YR89_9PEZI|nr:hypothetical protein QBC38DRAFT_462032 [Podospora fimiseda]
MAPLRIVTCYRRRRKNWSIVVKGCAPVEALQTAWKDIWLCLLTPKWIHEANRIKRRATTDGGKDPSLIEVVFKWLSCQPSIVKQFEEAKEANKAQHEISNLSLWEPDLTMLSLETDPTMVPREVDLGMSSWKTKAMDAVKNMCMFKHQSFHLEWTFWDDTPERTPAIHWITRNAISGLPAEELQKPPPGSWHQTLSQMVEQLVETLKLPGCIENAPVVVLELTEGHVLWDSTGFING